MSIDLTKLEYLTVDQIDDIQFDTGIFVKDFDIDDFRESIMEGQVSRVTKDSFSISVQRDTVNVLSDLNGVHFDYLEGIVTTKITASVSFTLASMSKEDLAMALGGATIDGDTITIKYALDAADFQNVALILPILDGGFVVAELPKALSTGGLSISTSKAAVGGLSCTMTGFKSLADNTIEPIILYRITPEGSLGEITVASAAGTAVGDTKLTLSGYTPASGESYVYKVGTTTAAPTIAYHAMPDYTWTPWDGTSDITAQTNKKIAVVSVNQNGAVAYGSATVTAKS
ncbi:MAG: hypothetical protein J6S92_01965 [Oscillospiraceae bacterium]|nr:hypothetical protein [Oscillospiraceae bacterium]